MNEIIKAVKFKARASFLLYDAIIFSLQFCKRKWWFFKIYCRVLSSKLKKVFQFRRGFTLVADPYTIFSRFLQSTKRWLNCILHSHLLVDCKNPLKIREKHNFKLYLYVTSDRRPLCYTMATKETLIKLPVWHKELARQNAKI